MFTKVIIGDDGTAGGRDAVALARALAPDAEHVLACAYPFDETAGRATLLGYGQLLRDDAEAALRTRAKAELPDARIVAVPDTSPGHALKRLAEREGANLVVVGSSRLGVVGRILLGDAVRTVLHGAPCPVVVAPRDLAARPPAVIGVAWDGSEEARRALDVAADVARAHGARLRVRFVVENDLLPSLPVVPVTDLYGDLRAEAQAELEAATADLDVPVTCAAVLGPLATRLQQLAADVDLMVCGSRGWGPVRRVALGSSADRLVHQAPCPVLVVPRTATPTPEPAPAPDARPRVLVAYASTHGHTGRIAERLGAVLAEEGLAATVRPIEEVTEADVAGADGVIAAASVHAGHHQRAMVSWLRAHADALAQRPTALVSASLTAAEDTDAARATTQGLIDEVVADAHLAPTATLAVAGALQYEAYHLPTRLLMRHIARQHDAATDHDVELTDWAGVEAFARDFAATVRG